MRKHALKEISHALVVMHPLVLIFYMLVRTTDDLMAVHEAIAPVEQLAQFVQNFAHHAAALTTRLNKYSCKCAASNRNCPRTRKYVSCRSRSRVWTVRTETFNTSAASLIVSSFGRTAIDGEADW